MKYALEGDSLRKYNAGRLLLEAYANLEEDITHNYLNGSVEQRALASIAGLQGDLFSSYLILLLHGTIVGRSVVLRSILENQGNILHIKGNEKRSLAYLRFTVKMQKQLKDRIDGKKTDKKDLEWTSCNITKRVSEINSSTSSIYATLSDFVHGNNIQSFINTKELTSKYFESIDSCFVGLFIGLMIEVGTQLQMSEKNHELILSAIEKANSIVEEQ